MLTYGVAFQLLGEAALDYLNQREIHLGGYKSHITLFQPKDSSLEPFPVLLYVAIPSNEHWLGPESLDKVAQQVSFLHYIKLILRNNIIDDLIHNEILNFASNFADCIFFRKQWT